MRYGQQTVRVWIENVDQRGGKGHPLESYQRWQLGRMIESGWQMQTDPEDCEDRQARNSKTRVIHHWEEAEGGVTHTLQIYGDISQIHNLPLNTLREWVQKVDFSNEDGRIYSDKDPAHEDFLLTIPPSRKTFRLQLTTFSSAK